MAREQTVLLPLHADASSVFFHILHAVTIATGIMLLEQD